MESAGALFLEELPVKRSNPTCEGVRNDPFAEGAAVALMIPVTAVVVLMKLVIVSVGGQDVLLYTVGRQFVSRGPFVDGTVNGKLSPPLCVALATVRFIMSEL